MGAAGGSHARIGRWAGLATPLIYGTCAQEHAMLIGVLVAAELVSAKLVWCRLCGLCWVGWHAAAAERCVQHSLLVFCVVYTCVWYCVIMGHVVWRCGSASRMRLLKVRLAPSLGGASAWCASFCSCTAA